MDFNQVNSEDFYKKSNKKIFTYLKNFCTIKNIFVIIFFTTLLIITGVKNKKKESQIRKKNNSNSEYFDLLIEKEMELNNQKRIFKNYNIDLDNIDTKIEELKEKNKTLIAEINELKIKNDEQKLIKAEVEDENNLLKSSKTQILEQQTNKTNEIETLKKNIEELNNTLNEKKKEKEEKEEKKSKFQESENKVTLSYEDNTITTKRFILEGEQNSQL